MNTAQSDGGSLHPAFIISLHYENNKSVFFSRIGRFCNNLYGYDTCSTLCSARNFYRNILVVARNSARLLIRIPILVTVLSS